MAKLQLTVIIMGAGQVGQGLARRLTKEGHQVKIIDANTTLLAEIENHVDAMCIAGNGASAQVLIDAGIQNADLFIGVSDNDECNMVSASLAKQFNVTTAIARVRNEEYLVPDRALYADAMHMDLIINPDEVASLELHDLLMIPMANSVAEFAEGRLKLIGFQVKPESLLCGKALKELPKLGYDETLLFACVVRSGDVVVPRGDTIVNAGDQVYVITSPSAYGYLSELGGVKDATLKKVVVVGASRAAFFLAERLEAAGVHLIIIEEDEARCELFADLLQEATILHGDGTDMSMLKEAGVRDADGFIASSQDDETNILAALLAKQEGAKRVISITRKPQYIPLLRFIEPIDVAINPRLSTINAIMRFVRKGKTLSMTTLADDRAEAIELEVVETSPLVGKKLKENPFPQNVLLGAIVRGDEIIIPKGEDALLAGDHAIMIALSESVGKLDDLFADQEKNGWRSMMKKAAQNLTTNGKS
ncbi:MAG: Trk system potassium transporter TrkA [Candidatus Hinthialibacter antarcticus]|nr:Trk system potassium transporter TrkA [Candidatus Hinthialibacter antarcticus]